MSTEKFDIAFYNQKCAIEHSSFIPDRLIRICKLSAILKDKYQDDIPFAYPLELSSLIIDTLNKRHEEFTLPLEIGEECKSVLKELINLLPGNRQTQLKISAIRLTRALMRTALNVRDHNAVLKLLAEINEFRESSADVKTKEVNAVQENIPSRETKVSVSDLESKFIDGSDKDYIKNYYDQLDKDFETDSSQVHFATAYIDKVSKEICSVGAVETLKVKISECDDEDMILITNPYLSQSNFEHDSIYKVLNLVKNRGEAGPKDRYHQIGITIDDHSQSVFTGNSLNTALYFALYSQFTYHYNLVKYAALRSNVVFTGDIDESGNLIPVDEKSLRAKIIAAFYDSTEIFVLPAEQKASAEAVVEELSAKYPGKQFELIALSNVNDVKNDTRVINWHPHEPVKLLQTRFKRALSKINTALLILIAVVICFMGYKPVMKVLFKDQTPTAVAFSGDMITMLNKDEQTLFDVQVSGEQLRDPLFTISDIDGDGNQEILLVPRYKDKLSNELICIDADHNLLWKKTLGMEIEYPDAEYNATIENYQILNILMAEDLDNDGIKEIIVNTNIMPYFPYVVYILNSEGEQLNYYHHSGGINAIEFMDLDSDGIKELLIGGVFQDKRQACLSVVSLKDLPARSPGLVDSPRIPTNLPAGKHLLYCVFPESVLGTSEYGTTFGYISSITFRRDLIEVKTNDVFVKGRGGEVMYLIDFDLILQKASLTSDFVDLWEEITSAKKTDNESAAYQTQLAQGVMYYRDGVWK